jgi:uncharacterized membrane protein
MPLMSRLIPTLKYRPRLLVAASVGLVAVALVPQVLSCRDVTRWLIGWNLGATVYLVMAAWMMARSSSERMRRRALTQDEGAGAILAMVVLAALASLGGILAELGVARDEHGFVRYMHIGLAALTVVTSWAFTQVMFALHYAHEFYLAEHRGQSGGLVFPGTAQPDYLDFVYAAAIIGTSAQTADVAFSSPKMRRVGLVHSVLAFLFNTTLLALTVNVGASLI